LSIAQISKHQYYYKPKKGKPGRKPTNTTLKLESNNSTEISNTDVAEEIVKLQKDPDTDYGYRKTTTYLVLLGYLINHKKVYRIMQDYSLLKEKHRKTERTYVKYRKVLPTSPLEVLEMDIKFVWVEKDQRYAFILSVIDTFTRVILAWEFAFSFKQALVKKVWERIIEKHLQPYDCLKRNIRIEVRNDNDSRFIAKSVQKFFAENNLTQVFTHPYTPQENGHIESFHAILSQKLNRYHIYNTEQLQQILTLFYEKYNNQRLHSSVLNLPPMIFWEAYENQWIKVITDYKKKKIKFKLRQSYQYISGKMNLREVLCNNIFINNKQTNNEKYSAETFLSTQSV
jgi:putative transposase